MTEMMSTERHKNGLSRLSYKLHNEPESGSALILVLAIVLLLTILTLATLNSTNSSVGLSGSYYGNSTAQLASQAGIDATISNLNATGKSGAPNYSNYPCESSGSIANSGGATEHYVTNIVYEDSNGTPIGNCAIPPGKGTYTLASNSGSTVGPTASTPVKAVIYSTGWLGTNGNNPKNSRYQATTVATASITDTAATLPNYAIYAGNSFIVKGDVTVLPGAGQIQPNLYSNTIRGSGTFILGSTGAKNAACNSGTGANDYIGGSGSTTFQGGTVIYGCVYSNGIVNFENDGNTINQITSYYDGTSSSGVNLYGGARVLKGITTYYGKQVSVTGGASGGTIVKNPGPPTVNLVNQHQPAPQPIPVSSNNTSDPIVIVPPGACSNLDTTGQGTKSSPYNFKQDSGTISFSTSNSGNSFTYNSGLDITVSSGTATTSESVSKYLNSLPNQNQVLIYNWPSVLSNSGGLNDPNVGGTQSLLGYLIDQSVSPITTMTIYAPACALAVTGGTFTLGSNVAIFANSIDFGENNSLTMTSNLPSPPTFSLVAYPNQPTASTSPSTAALKFVVTGGGVTINNVHPFFWTSGTFASGNSTTIDAQIYAEQNVILKDGINITFYQVANNVLRFLGAPIFSQQNQYLQQGG